MKYWLPTPLPPTPQNTKCELNWGTLETKWEKLKRTKKIKCGCFLRVNPDLVNGRESLAWPLKEQASESCTAMSSWPRLPGHLTGSAGHRGRASMMWKVCWAKVVPSPGFHLGNKRLGLAEGRAGMESPWYREGQRQRESRSGWKEEDPNKYRELISSPARV